MLPGMAEDKLMVNQYKSAWVVGQGGGGAMKERTVAHGLLCAAQVEVAESGHFCPLL